MAFPSNTGTKRDDLANAWAGARSVAAQVKGEAQNVRALSANSTLPASRILQFSMMLDDSRQLLAAYAAVPGIGTYAQSQVNDPTLNIGAEFTAMVNAIAGVSSWIATNFPKDGGGYLLAQTITAEGRTVDRVFTAPATATFRTQLDALIAAID